MTKPKICIAQVSTGLFSTPTRQCRTPAKYGDYCALHNPEYVKRKKEAQERRWETNRVARTREHIARVIGEMVISELEVDEVIPSKWEYTDKYNSKMLLSLYLRRRGARQ